MKSYIICFTIYGRSSKVRVQASSELEAKKKILNAIIFDHILDLSEDVTITKRLHQLSAIPTLKESRIPVDYILWDAETTEK